MDYVKIIFHTNSEQIKEMIIAFLSEETITGFEERDNELIAYSLSADFTETFRNKITELKIPFSTKNVAQKNWNEEWERNFNPVMIDKNGRNYCFIRAFFHESKTADFEIIITPKMSFGTGHHETTFMMILQMSELTFQNKSVVDFGCGTGILAIHAKQLGASNILAVDNDPWCIENSIENFEINGCNDIVTNLVNSFPNGNYDIVLANINLNIIKQNIESISKSCNQNAIIILSGMLIEDKNEIFQILEFYNFKEIDYMLKGNWISVKAKKV